MLDGVVGEELECEYVSWTSWQKSYSSGGAGGRTIEIRGGSDSTQGEWAWHQPIALLLCFALFLDSRGRWIATPYWSSSVLQKRKGVLGLVQAR